MQILNNDKIKCLWLSYSNIEPWEVLKQDRFNSICSQIRCFFLYGVNQMLYCIVLEPFVFPAMYIYIFFSFLLYLLKCKIFFLLLNFLKSLLFSLCISQHVLQVSIHNTFICVWPQEGISASLGICLVLPLSIS